ncbi:MAG: bifunctional DNA primase/polymerase [Thermus sp.]|uniref:bifunctional DNA primase/polymerase n=1 Tax=Thermus sp. TaxID=275 RepID=UPI00391E014A
MKKASGRPAPTPRLMLPQNMLPQAGGGALGHRASRYEAALDYARLGYRVLPLHPGEKRPHGSLVPHGLKEASREAEAIRAWWGREPGAGVGILAPEAVLVLDVDQAAVWEGLRKEYPALLEAPRQRTPKGGVHVFLRLPEGLGGALSATVRRMAGVDLRGLGRAYVVAAPTRLADGRGYTWEVPLVEPEALPLVPPALLRALLPPPPPPPQEVRIGEGSPRRLRGLLEAYADRVAAAPIGTRHNTLIAYARAAGGLIPHGLDPQEAEEALVAAAMQAGLPEAEARAAVRWGLEVGARQPLHLDQDFGPSSPFCANPLAQNPFASWTAKTRFCANEAHRYREANPWVEPNPWAEEGGGGWR